MAELTLIEAFEELVKKRAWYRNAPIGIRQAQKDKYEFLKGKNIPEARIRIYLEASGAVCSQQEKWILKEKNNTNGKE